MNKETECVEIHILFFFYMDFSLFKTIIATCECFEQ